MIENFGHALGGMAQDRGRARLQALVDRRHGIKSPDELRADLAEVRAENLENHKNAVVNKALYRGACAQTDALREALKAIAPNHPLLQVSTQKYADGKVKSKLRLLFEATFDATLREVGGAFGSNPKAYRND